MLIDLGYFLSGAASVLAIAAVASYAVHKFKKKVEAAEKEEEAKDSMLAQVVASRDVDHNTMPKMRIGVIEAMNGRILEVSTAIPNNHNHYDWKTEMYVVPEEQKLSEAIALVMLMKGLEK